MKKNNKLTVIITLTLLAALLYFGWKNVEISGRILGEKNIGVLLVYDLPGLSAFPGVLPAYESVLKEEGVIYRKIEATRLVTLPPKIMAEGNAVVIFPDSVAKAIPKEAALWAADYLEAGGSIMVVYDAGVKDKLGHYLSQGVFSEQCGLNYIRYSSLKDASYASGKLKFKDQDALKYFEIPSGKLSPAGFISGYTYGALDYPVAMTLLMGVTPDEILAHSCFPDGSRQPAVVIRKNGNGNVFYANIPLGYLKAYGDDLLLRECLRAFLFKRLTLPHLVNTPYGKGGLVINWHVDASPDYEGVLNAYKKKLLRETITYSIHITAGDFRDRPGDAIGFDAEGKGLKYVELLKAFGTIGCHGGWGHNWFAENVENKTFGGKEIREYIKKNKDSLERLVDYKIDEYSAPSGMHPQPEMTKALEEGKYCAYYYDGDTGAPPNRTFFDGKMVSDKVIAFPIMPLFKYASLYEMSEKGVTSEEMSAWLNGILGYIEGNRTVRLIYSHFRDIGPYEKVFGEFLDNIETLQADGKILVKPMSYFAKFLQRYLKTEFSYEQSRSRQVVRLKNREGLEGITVAIPSDNTYLPKHDGFLLKEEKGYFYFTEIENMQEQTISIDYVNPRTEGEKK